MEALIALKSSHFRNNCESELAAFGPFFLTWMHEIRSCNITKDDLSFRSELGLFPLDETYMCYSMQLRLRQILSLPYKGYPFDTYIHNERRLFTTASFATQQVSLRERIRLLAGRV